MSNLIPEGGIWMNTQRPEWNDNNALVGNGVSMVTLCYLRDFKILSANHRKIHIRKRKKFLVKQGFIMPLGSVC
jgi:hypothetical protein